MVTLFSRCAVVHKSLAGRIVKYVSSATAQACSIENKVVSSQLENNLQVKCAWQRRWKQRSCHCKFLDHTSWSTVRGVGYRNPRSGLAVMAVALWNDFEICEIKLYVELWSKSCRSKPTVARLCLRCCALQAKVQSLLELVKIRACRCLAGRNSCKLLRNRFCFDSHSSNKCTCQLPSGDFAPPKLSSKTSDLLLGEWVSVKQQAANTQTM